MLGFTAIHIKMWYGRFGNNVRQMCNVLQIALHHNLNIKMPHHKFFNTKILQLRLNSHGRGKTMTNMYNFYYPNRVKQKIDKDCFNHNLEKILKLLKEAFIIKNIPCRQTNDLIIHLRSGDIFGKGPRLNAIYITPPLCFYDKIIQNNEFDNIILVAEDYKNPVINALLKKYPEIKWNPNSLEEDIKIILSAENLAESFGTFTPTLAILSDNIKKMWTVSYQLKICGMYVFPHKIEVDETDMSDYRKRMFPWKNNKKQRQLMLSYSFPKKAALDKSDTHCEAKN